MDIVTIEVVEPDSDELGTIEYLREEPSETESPELSIEELEQIFGA